MSFKKVTRPQFKVSLKSLSLIKGGKVNKEQRRSLNRVITYIHDHSPPTAEDGCLYISAIDDIDYVFRMFGSHDRIVEMLTNLLLRDQDVSDVFLEALENANNICISQVTEYYKKEFKKMDALEGKIVSLKKTKKYGN